jgi:hypothetical protein
MHLSGPISNAQKDSSIARYELTDVEWIAIELSMPNNEHRSDGQQLESEPMSYLIM